LGRNAMISLIVNTHGLFTDITDTVADFVKDMPSGFVLVRSLHTTAGIKLMENEPLLLGDTERFLERLVPRDTYYQHDDIERRRNVPDNERKNARSHLCAFFGSDQAIIPVTNGKLRLGEWQRVMVVEFDPCRRRVVELHEIDPVI